MSCFPQWKDLIFSRRINRTNPDKPLSKTMDVGLDGLGPDYEIGSIKGVHEPVSLSNIHYKPLYQYKAKC